MPTVTEETSARQSFQVVCREFRACSKNTLQGFAVLVISPPGLVLHDCSLHERGGKSWIGLPARPYEKNGARQWSRTVDFDDKNIYFKFQSLALKAIAAFRSGRA